MGGDWRTDLGLPHPRPTLPCSPDQSRRTGGSELFDVSLHLLVRHVPPWLAHGLSPLEQIQRHGRAMGLIRPSTRRLPQLPNVSWQDICWPPPDLPLQRPPRYSHRPAGNRTRKKPPS